MSETDLILGDLIIPVGAGRGITQTLSFVNNGDLRRTVNGKLVDVTRKENRKYVSTVSCTDMDAPSISEIWRGEVLDVSFIVKLSQAVSPPSQNVTISREAVAGSIQGFDTDGLPVPIDSITGQDIEFEADVALVSYNPLLEMMVVDVSVNTDEYDAQVGWSIQLEEV